LRTKNKDALESLLHSIDNKRMALSVFKYKEQEYSENENGKNCPNDPNSVHQVSTQLQRMKKHISLVNLQLKDR
jgi:hypothetical protein